MIRYNVGVKQEQYTVPSIDGEYWTEVLGITLIDTAPPAKASSKANPATAPKITFPLAIQANYKDQIHSGRLINLKGVLRWNNQDFATPSSAAKTVAVDWKAVNGWDFWHYQDPETGKWEKIGKLRKQNL